MKNTIIFILLINSFFTVLGQNVDTEIQSIRNKYYRVTGKEVNLQVLKMDNYEFYLENNSLVIIKLYEKAGHYEFYTDKENRAGLYSYFAFFESNEKENPDLRAYYTRGMNLIKYMEDQNVIEFSTHKRPDNEIAIKCINSLNTFLNMCSENLNVYSKEIDAIEKYISQVLYINDMATPDTVKNYLNEDESYEKHLIIQYKDKKGKVFKKISTSVSDHYWTEKTEILMDEKVVYETTQNIATYQTSSKSINHTYYNRQRRIKTIDFENYEIGIDNMDFSKFIPRIQYY